VEYSTRRDGGATELTSHSRTAQEPATAINSKSLTLAARRQEMTDEPMRKVRGREWLLGGD
jgi:hypothetical protein